jgi:predicted metalloprotease with PDZ domain
MSSYRLVLPFLLVAFVPQLAAVAPPPPAPVPITVSVDATDAMRGLFHSTVTMPAPEGTVTFHYPKWVPGEHTPTGPIMQVAGLRVAVAGKPLAWRRDPVDVFSFHVDLPTAVESLEISFDYLSAASTFAAGYGESANATSEILDLPWNHVVMYPAGTPADQVHVRASLRLPAGWSFDTALPLEKRDGDLLTFAPVTLVTFIDSPLIAGKHYRKIDTERGTYVAIVADSEAALALPETRVDQLKRLVREADALFGARHYHSYRWLVTLSDAVEWQGLEHHESSDNRFSERSFLDATLLQRTIPVLAHEYTHSWNGKFRRPAGLATDDYQKPMQGELLWVYEGMTRFIGDFLLTSRSGMRDPEQVREWVAWVAANLEYNRPGRATRPLADTAVGVQVLSGAPVEWTAYRRALDYYDESLFIWLDADTLIRSKTNGQKSMDDFAKAFFGPPPLAADETAVAAPYTLDRLIATLNSIAPNDWRGFLKQRVYDVAPHAPLAGLERAGWRLTITDQPNGYGSVRERATSSLDLSLSLGLWTKNDGTITDVVFGGPALDAGLAPGMKILALNGRKWSTDVAQDEVTASKTTTDPMEIIAEQAAHLRVFRVHYHGGARYAHLVRIPDTPDVLSTIIAPRTK